VRITLDVDDALNARLHRLVSGRDLNGFINKAVAEKVAALEKEKIRQSMREGYLATAAEHDELAKDWEAVDLEGWPEYRPKPRSLGIGASGYAGASRRTSEERPVPRSWR